MNAEEKNEIISDDKKPSFCVHIDFKPGLENPQRLFQTSANYIEALQSIDRLLISSIESDIKTVFLLEELEIGSLKIWLRSFLKIIDDDALKNLDWKPAVGRYLVKGKYLLLKACGETKTLPTEDKLVTIASELHELAKETGVRRLPVYKKISVSDIANEALVISDALKNLSENESITFISDDGEAKINSEFKVVQEDINRLLTANTIENNVEQILMVRKPDFLGETKWDFRYQKRNISASIEDLTWLEQFQRGEIDIRPGDALRVVMHESVSYSSDGEVIEEKRSISVVKSVIKQQQIKLQ